MGVELLGLPKEWTLTDTGSKYRLRHFNAHREHQVYCTVYSYHILRSHLFYLYVTILTYTSSALTLPPNMT